MSNIRKNVQYIKGREKTKSALKLRYKHTLECFLFSFCYICTVYLAKSAHGSSDTETDPLKHLSQKHLIF